MGMRGTATCELSFDNIELPADSLVGDEGKGFMMAMQALDGARISIGAIASGLMQHAMDKAAAYARERTTFGKPIAGHQAVGFKFADMAAKIRATDLMVWDTCELKRQGKRFSVEAAELKLLASRWACEVCDDCIQIFGGNGYSEEFDVERFYRDAKLLEIGEGTSEILRLIISSSVLGR
ncbi:MAG: acyl-CoA dehydrogenase, partial [Pyramidobacter sp.]